MAEGDRGAQGAGGFDATVPAEESAPAGGSAALLPGARVGRYYVTDVLGAGAMGVVLAAHDPELDRRIALKFLKPTAWGGSSSASRGRERLIREARAMARLQHAHVLTVHDVGTLGDEVFVAMEFAAGGTLRDWLATPRTWREVVDKFRQAGRGLAAAHQAGFVHRDFKPDNVLLTADGQVRVADFGLVGSRAGEVPDGEEADYPVTSLEQTLTRTGALLGTPAYMAPEQHARDHGRVGPPADQYAFCIALWEALWGTRPFQGASTHQELARRKAAREVAPPPAGRDVPSWLDALLRRGLEPDPDRRWPSMAALVAALEQDPQTVRRRRMLLAAGAVAIAVPAAAAAWMLSRSAAAPAPAPSPCAGAPERMAQVWDETRRASVRASFAASGRAHAATTFERVAAALDAWGATWAETRTDACLATRVRGEQSEQLMDLRMACLDRRLAETGALIDLFARAPDAVVVDEAVTAVASLGDLDACADVRALTGQVSPDPAVAGRVQELERRVAEALALRHAGKFADGVRVATAVVDEARALGYAPLLARALLELGRLHFRNGDGKAAEAALTEAGKAAAEARTDDVAAEAWIDLMHALGPIQGRIDDALRLQPVVEAVLARAGTPPLAESKLHGVLGILMERQGKFAEAEAHFSKVVAIRRRELGPDHPELADALGHLGIARFQQGKVEDARGHFDQVLQLRLRTVGPDHPDVAYASNLVARALHALGKYEEARAQFERALALFEKYLPGHRDIGFVHNSLAVLLGDQGKLDEAQVHQEKTLVAWEKAFGPDHQYVGMALTNLASLAGRRGRLDESLDYARRALALVERTLGPDHPETSIALGTLGGALALKKDFAAARPVLERALAIRRKALGAAHPDVAWALDDLGDLARDQGRLGESERHFRAALSLREKGLGPEHPLLAKSLLGLARARARQGGRAEAIELAERALRLNQAGGGDPAERAAIAALLDELRPKKSPP